MTEAQPTESTEKAQEEPAAAAATQEPAAQEEAPAESMESLMASHDAYEESFRELKRGEFLTGRVIQINDDGAMVDVGYKTEGFIPLSQLTHRKDVPPGKCQTLVSASEV